jgi:hypothetical protein
MVHKHKNHENQIDLFEDNIDDHADKRFRLLKPAPVAHDYGGKRSTDPNESGHEFPFVQSQSEITVDARRVAVSLQGRAQALMNILDFYAQNNRTSGSSKQRLIGNSDFNMRYEPHSGKVQAGAERKRHERLQLFHEAVTYLAQQQEMIDAGLIEDDSAHEISLQADLNKHFAGKSARHKARRGKQAKLLFDQAKAVDFPLTTSENRSPITKNEKI